MDEVRRTALLTGATGFIGRNLAVRLLQEGWDLHAIVRPTSDVTSLQGSLQSVTMHVYDGTTDSIFRIMDEVRPDVVFHLASLFIAEHHKEDVTRLIQSNVLFSTQLVDAMRETGCSSLVNTGTSWQHFRSSLYEPACLYAATKQAFEALLEFYVNSYSIRAITLKLFDTYGPNDTRRKLLPMLMKTLESAARLDMSPGQQKIDLVFIDDVTRAFAMAADRLVKGQVETQETYAVDSGSPVTLRELVDTLEIVTGKEIAIEWGARPYRNREVMVPWNTGVRMPGWKPDVSLEEGLHRLWMAAQKKGC